MIYMAQYENYSFLPFPPFQEEAQRKTPYIVGGTSIQKLDRSCHYTPHPINCDLKNKSTHAFVPFVTA
jgi:hypothetical protein